MMNLIEAWGNYYFESETGYYKIVESFGHYAVWENVEDDINYRIYEGTLEECVTYLEELGAVNYDPLKEWR